MKRQKKNSHENITWSEMGMQNVQAKKVHFVECFILWLMGIYFNQNKRRLLHKNRVQFPEDSLGTPTWPPFICLRTPINMAAVTSGENTLEWNPDITMCQGSSRIRSLFTIGALKTHRYTGDIVTSRVVVSGVRCIKRNSPLEDNKAKACFSKVPRTYRATEASC
mgnify:CR=1 FL=1